MLTTHHSNRLEALATVLAELTGQRPLPPMQPELVVVPHRSMGHWLSMTLAAHQGAAANLRFPMLGALAWTLLQRHWPALPEGSPYDREALRWRVLERLPALLSEPGFEPLQGYLGEEAGPRGVKAYQLAGRLAALYDEYLVYRPEWILDWDAGGGEHWQARLWRSLADREDDGPTHRAALLSRYIDALNDGAVETDSLPPRISVFGLASAPPVYLALLAALARHIEVDVYVLNPSLHYWGDVVSERGLAKLRGLWRRHGLPDASAYYSLGHPLLGSLGRTGREYLELLQSHSDDDVLAFDAGVEDSPDVLGRLQADLLFLRNRGAAGEAAPEPARPQDRSIQVHACHSPMREVQVLHDQLRRLFAETDLQPRDVVVMTPDIDRYAPYIEAVFGNAGGERYIPWSVTDRALSGAHPIIQVFGRLLELPRSRLTASDVLAVLEVPAVHRRFALDGDAVERIRAWVRDSGVRWGADARHRAAEGLPAWETHTWRFGLRRLMLGYALDDAVELYADVAPLHQVEGGAAAALGQLQAFFDTLTGLQRSLGRDHTPAEWQALLNSLIEALFQPEDGADEQALQTVREAVTAVIDHTATAGFAAPLPLETVRAALLDRLHSEGVRGGYLTGQVTFCAMVPMRSVPFRVVCLLGLNDRDFPRQSPGLAFDLMAGEHRAGDRSLREDDRFLFLEALLSARECFYISYVGRDIRDNSVKLPSVVVSELLDTLDRGFTTADGRPLGSVLTTVHPLQPFSRQYQGAAEAAVFSYATDWLRPSGAAPAAEAGTGERFVNQGLGEPDPEYRDVDLEALIRFYRNPAAAFLGLRLDTRLDDAAETEADSEPFNLDNLTRYQLEQRLLEQRLAGRSFAALEQRLAGEGMLPEGPFGEAVMAEIRDAVEAFREAVEAHRQPAGAALEVDLALGEFRLTGWIGALAEGQLLSYRPAHTKAKDLLRVWLTHLAANATVEDGVTSVHLGKDGVQRFRPMAAGAARDHLRTLLGHYWAGLMTPLPFFPETSRAYAEKLEAGEEKALKAATDQWQGVHNANVDIAGEGEQESIAVVFRGREPLAEDAFAELARAVYAPLLACLETDG